MSYKACYLLLIFFCFIFSVKANSEIYDFTDAQEYLDLNYIRRYIQMDSEDSDLFINYSYNFLEHTDRSIYFKSTKQKSELICLFEKKNVLRIFAKSYFNKFTLAFGSFKPSFGLGNIYQQDKASDFVKRVLVTSPSDLKGVYFTSKIGLASYKIYYSHHQMNFIKNSDGDNRLVYFDSDKTSLEELAFVYDLELPIGKSSLLLSHFQVADKLSNFDNKLNSNLISLYSKISSSYLTFEYENNYYLSEFSHYARSEFMKDKLSSTLSYQKTSGKSLNWMSSGISNKYSRNSTKLLLNCEYADTYYKLAISSELKRNLKLKQWRNKNYLKLNYHNYGYSFTQEKYLDYSAQEINKYTNKLKARLFTFDKTFINFDFSVNNKKDDGFASYYDLTICSKSSLGTLTAVIKVLDNYKNEEILMDYDNDILASFYKFSEDVIVSASYSSIRYKRLRMEAKIVHSLNNNKLTKAKIDLNYLL